LSAGGGVLASDQPLRERRLRAPVGLLGAGDHQQPGGVTVEPMHNARALGLAARELWREQLGERLLAMPARGVHDDARALVHDDQVLVAVGDREGLAAA